MDNKFKEDLDVFEKYEFLESTMEDIKEYLEAKNDYLENPTMELRCRLKDCFQYAHTGLKMERSRHIISPAILQELTQLLNRGL